MANFRRIETFADECYLLLASFLLILPNGDDIVEAIFSASQPMPMLRCRRSGFIAHLIHHELWNNFGLSSPSFPLT